MSGPTVLLISQDALLVKEIRRIGCDGRDLQFTTCSSEDDACACLENEDVVLVLLHLTPASAPLIMRLLPQFTAAGLPASLVLSDPACASRESAVLAAGATEFLRMPNDLGRLADILDALDLPNPGEFDPVTEEDPRIAAVADPFFCALAPEMAELADQIRRVAPQDTTLLFTGETGTGKTRLARMVHEFSPRRDQPFLVVDCGALSPSLIETEMFGHVRGAFTGADRDRAGKLAAAGSGTLLLDEINSLPLNLQAKLLRAADDRVFEPVGSNKAQPLRARLIAVSNAPLEREVEAGRFRSDLYYRLNVVGFFLPPLRDRRAAIAPLAAQFVAEFAARNRPDVHGVTRSALRALEEYAWPGNIRELRNVTERAVALCAGPEVQPRDLPEAVRAAAAAAVASDRAPVPVGSGDSAAPGLMQPTTLAQSREETEIRRIQEALAKHRNNRQRTAAELGISRFGLYKKLHKYRLNGSA